MLKLFLSLAGSPRITEHRSLSISNHYHRTNQHMVENQIRSCTSFELSKHMLAQTGPILDVQFNFSLILFP